jgi:hypothetical protein
LRECENFELSGFTLFSVHFYIILLLYWCLRETNGENKMKIALRNKPTKTQGRSLYLDFYDNGRRWYEFLNLFLTGDHQRDKETMRLADGIISQRRLDAAATQNGLPAPSKMKADFIEYCRKLGETKLTESSRHNWKRAIDHFARFAGKGGMTFAAVN